MNMRSILSLAALLIIAGSSAAGAKDKTSDISGSWKETKRYTSAKDPVRFTDTVRIDFLIGNEYTWQKDMGFMNRGTYKLSSETLDLGTRLFTIAKMTDERMVLRNDAGVYEFIRYNKNTAEDNSKAGSTGRAYNPGTSGQVKQELLAGKWEVYKRTSAVQQTKIDYTRILKTIDISVEQGAVTGTAKAAEMKPGSDTWTIERFANGTLHCTGPDARSFKVLQASSQELVLQEGDMTYFFKVFK